MNRLIDYTCPNDKCGGPHVEATFEPGERGWGSDADGNRGTNLPGNWSAEAPDVCPSCGRVYTDGEWLAINQELEDVCQAPYIEPETDWEDRDTLDWEDH